MILLSQCKDPLQPHAYLVIMFTLVYIIFFTSNNHTYECTLLFNNRQGSCSFWFRSKEGILQIQMRTSNEQFSHNLNMEIMEPLHCPNRQIYSLPLVLLHFVLLVQHHTNSLQGVKSITTGLIQSTDRLF